ncbi:MAG: TolC family protein [Firmicutes bacterium]|nr:TolC family protein [Bacillota bacterium]
MNLKMTSYFVLALLFVALLLLPGLAMAQAADDAQASLQALSLDQAQKLAINNNAQLKAAAWSVKIAEDNLKEAKAGFLPTIVYSWTGNLTDPATPFPLAANPLNASNFLCATSVSANEILYSGGKIRNSIKLAELKLASAQEDERKIKQQVLYNVKDVYYRLWATEKMFVVTQNSYKNMDDHYQQVNKLYLAGSASKFDLLRAKVQCESFRPQMIQAQSNLDAVRLSLASLIGLDSTQLFTTVIDPGQLNLPNKVELVESDLLNLAYQNRPEMRQMAQAVEIAKTNLEMANAGFLPTLNLSAKYSGTTDLIVWKPNWTLTLNVTGTAYDGAASRARADNARDNLKLIALREQSLRDSIRLELEQACQNIQQSLDIIQTNQSLINFSKETLKLTQNRFESGIATIIDIADAQLALDKILGGYYQGIASYLSALAKLDLVTGID